MMSSNQVLTRVWRLRALAQSPVYLALIEAELLQGRTEESLELFEWYLGASQRARIVHRTTGDHNANRLPPALLDHAGVARRLPQLSQQTVIAYGWLPS